MTTTIILLISVFIVFYIGQRVIEAFVHKVGSERSIQATRIIYIKRTLILVWFFMATIFGISVTGKSFQDVGVLIGSSLAFLGVALFAQWSLLSNVTASVIVFFFFPYRMGDWVEVLDGENTIAGRVTEITLFHVILTDDTNNIVTYPNALVFQKAVKISKGLKGKTHE